MEDNSSRAMRQMPRYQCHKKVWALKIAALQPPMTPDLEGVVLMMTPADHGYGTIRLSTEYVSKHKPEVGGYYVQYEDGYLSYSPASAFEAGYTRCGGGMTFGDALRELKAGKRVARQGWNGKGMWIALTPGSVFHAQYAKSGHAAKHRADELLRDEPHDGTEKTIQLLPHIDMRTADGSMCVGWLASQTDMLAEDWMIVGEDS